MCSSDLRRRRRSSGPRGSTPESEYTRDGGLEGPPAVSLQVYNNQRNIVLEILGGLFPGREALTQAP